MFSKAKNLYCFLIIIVVAIILYICLKEESKLNSNKYLQHHEPRYHNYHHGNRSAPEQTQNHLVEATIEKNTALKGQTGDLFGTRLSNNEKYRKLTDVTPVNGQYEYKLQYLAVKARNRSVEYCNPPEIMKSGKEGKVLEGYTLRSVHIIIRHGDRSPMYKLPNQDSPHLSCHLDASDSVQHRRLIESFIRATVQSGGRIPYGQKFGWYPRQRTCMGAQLTGRGVVQHLVNGALLRSAYVDRHRLVDEKPAVGDVTVRSTDYSRTYQSALAFVHGLLPAMDLARLPLHITNNMNFCDDGFSGVSCFCPVIGQLREFAKKEEIKMKSNVTSYLIGLIKQQVAAIYGMSTHHVPWVGGIVEVLMGYVCHGLPLPCTRPSKAHDADVDVDGGSRCIDMPLIGRMWQYLDARGHIVLAGHAEQKYNILFVYPLLREIAHQLLNLSHGQPTAKITLYSGHDVTVTPLIKAFGIFNGHWVPYGSRLVIETYSSPDAQYYIRVLYNGDDVTGVVKFCRSHLVHDLCPLQYFVDFAFHEVFRIFGKDSYKQICKS